MFNFILPQFFIKVERWKWNKEYRVYVSNLGNFRDEHKQRLPIKIKQNGYCLVKTECGYKLAHRIVMLTWKPIPNAEELTVDHLNHNKRDNSLENLEWVTKEENCGRAKRDYYLDDKEVIVTKIQKIIIKSGQKEFLSYEEAVNWLIETQGMHDITDKAKVMIKIHNAVKNNTKYCGRKWKEVIKYV